MAISITNVTPNTGVAPGQKVALTGTELDTVDFFTVGGKVAQIASVPARTATNATVVVAQDAATGATTVNAYKGTAAPVQSGAVAVVAAVTTNATSTSSLARKWAVDVLDPADGTFKKLWFIKSFTPLIDPAFTDDPTFDDNGGPNQGKTGVDNKLTIKVSRKKNINSGAYDRAQEILRLTQLAFGGSEVVTARWYDRSGGSDDAYVNTFDVKYSEDGGNDRDVDTATIELMGKGIPTKISNPAG